MVTLFEQIKECNLEKKNRVVTVISGDHIGEKAFFSNEELIWYKDEKSKIYFSDMKFEKEGIRIEKLKETEIFIDELTKEKQLVICGAGHVACALTKMGKLLDFKVTVIDDRLSFVQEAKNAGADEVICDSFVNVLKQYESNNQTYFVIVTRGHRYDKDCLEIILEKKKAYVGMMGSRRRIMLLKQGLMEKGISKEVLEELHSPIGLNIGAETPSEIAVSIMAEIIEENKKWNLHLGYSEKIINTVLEKKDNLKLVLATIISRKGSAPREIGTKMLIAEDGNIVDTIGGGCMEADVIQKARVLMAKEDRKPQICTVDMTIDAAEEEGMVCGGILQVILEPIN